MPYDYIIWLFLLFMGVHLNRVEYGVKRTNINIHRNVLFSCFCLLFTFP